MNFSYCLIFLSFLGLPHTLQSSVPLVKTADIPSENTVANFLWNFFGIHPLFGTLQNDVQYKIVKQLRQQIFQPLPIEKPIRKHNVKPEAGEEAPEINALAFSSDGSHMAFCTEHTCTIADLRLTDTSTDESIKITGTIPGAHFKRVAFHPDGTSLAILNIQYIQSENVGWTSSIIIASLKDYTVASARQIPNILAFLHGEHKKKDRHGMLQESTALDNVSEIRYNPAGKLVLATNSSELFILDIEKGTFESYDSSEVPNKNGSSPTKEIRRTSAFFLHESPKVLLLDSNNVLKLCNYETRESHTLIDPQKIEFQTLVDPRKTINTSPAEQVIVPHHKLAIIRFKHQKEDESSDQKYADWTSLWDLETLKKIKNLNLFLFKRGLIGAFSNNERYIFTMHDEGDEIFHLGSEMVIAKKMTVSRFLCGSSALKIIFSRDGLFYATAASLRSKKATEICIGRCNPLWDNLEPLYNGRLNIITTLFIFFLRIIKDHGLSFEEAISQYADAASLDKEELRAQFVKLFLSLERSLQQYILLMKISIPSVL